MFLSSKFLLCTHVLNIAALLTHTIDKIKNPLSLHSCDLFAVTE